MTKNYQELIEYLGAQYEEVNGYDFYRDIFPDLECSGDIRTDYSSPNAIYLFKDDSGKMRRRIMLNDTWEDDYMANVERNPMTLCGGIAYRGRANTIQNAQQMNALIFDLDGVGLEEIRSLFLRFGGAPELLRRLPMPTYLVASGNGLHIYYVFSTPIALYPNIKLQLKALKYDLTFRMWEYKGTSQEKSIQYQSINQGFRMVGSTNNKYGTEVVAYKVGGKVSLAYLNGYAKPEHRVDVNKPFRPSKMSRSEARERYPEWYDRVILDGNKYGKKWDIRGKQGDALYRWWLSRVDSVVGGHRYFYLMCLAIYACKCDIPKAKLKRDMKTVFSKLENVQHTNALTEDDVESALEAYDEEYYFFTISDIEKLSGLRIERNKRNGRKQADHLRRARAVQKVDYPNNEWAGRPSAEQTVREYLKAHPDSSPKETAAALDVALSTVYKYR